MTDRSAVVTRFAPSPTGDLHIGGARTALFNLLYARHTGGRFLIRVEDTDRERSTASAVQAIFDGLAWLGVAADAEPVFQHTRIDRHREVVAELLAKGRAYKDFTIAEELEAERAAARAEGRVVRSAWRDRDPAEGGDRPFVLRFKSPLEGETLVDDLVKGPVRFQNKELDDLVLLRTDDTPTYNLAVVADDHDMGVTHVIRGDDHLNNAARQTLIYQALGWTVPAFAHIPLIHGPDGAKLSKRHGAQAVGEFAGQGYLPEGMRNYLARLGWGHGDDEIFTDAQAAEWFDIADVVKAPARLDWAKLNFVNQQYMRHADDARLTEMVAAVHQSRDVTITEAGRARLAAAIPLVKEGAHTTLELADLTAFTLLSRPVVLDEKSRKRLDSETLARLGRLHDHLNSEAQWDAPSLEAALRKFAEIEGVGLGKFGGALRSTLSGAASAPDLASALTALGKAESLGRLGDALSQPA
ncbi:glutamate--tRNA ligase [Caulobacter sp. S45]|uniref:glutamate--tRNA ligase n=1 Tax=Caulobacter sp. S45 TaxID=1641861 RepID=UPI00131C7326|nr:glutamate--tRNA ligase [Caulobacter sp. S45]